MLTRDLDLLRGLVNAAVVPASLEPYRAYLWTVCEDCTRDVAENQRRLALGVDAILEEMLSEVQRTTDEVCLLSRKLITPVLRATTSDTLCLKIIGWMHGTDPGTAALPGAFQDADPAVLPLMQHVPMYFFPPLEQRGLLLQPLLFHEFGHVLYRLHEPEMDALVAELQSVIAEALHPPSHRSDAQARKQAERRRAVVDTWYLWAQELFCDAVGLVMSGPAFLHAFSAYCGGAHRDDFSLPPDKLDGSAHPVTWLRVRLLAHRARALGYEEAAEAITAEWADVAAALDAGEDYFGFYEDDWQDAVAGTISDLLVEAGPRECLPVEAAPDRDWQPGDSPVLLLNRAWEQADRLGSGYALWESSAVETFLPENIPSNPVILP